MTTAITTIKESIEGKIESILTFKKLKHIDDVAKNSFKGGRDRYGVTSGTVTQSSDIGTIRSVTYTITYDVKLTTGFVNKQTENNAEVVIAELQDKMLTVYNDLVNTRAGQPAVVININNFINGAIEILEDDGVVTITSSIDIVFRDSL